MMKRIAFLSLFLLSLLSGSFSQGRVLTPYENLIGGTWTQTGVQLGLDQGKTEMTYRWGLNKMIVHVSTFTTDPTTKAFGQRNEGIRFYSNQERALIFFEFDKFGNVTKGDVIIDGKDIYYEYQYGDERIRDAWIYKSDDEYQVIVGQWKNGQWGEKYLDSVFKRS